MNCLINKILKCLVYILGFGGFILIIGSVGASDCAVEAGIYEPWYAHMGTMLIGLLVIAIAVLIAPAFEGESQEDERKKR